MIFITVGTQAPFDRLIKLMDNWIKENNMECFAQIYKGRYKPTHMSYKEIISEQEYGDIFNKASVIVSHAGMGTIISALKNDKVLLTLPRLAEYKEHRNDHQVDTTKAFSEKGYIYPVYSEKNLLEHLSRLSELRCLKNVGDKASNDLINFLKSI
nr:glycosyltransferase [uncultured Draconibacterium sp.]